MAGWSAGHRKTVIFGWLLLVALVFMAGQAIGAANLPQYDAGQSGQAERVLNQAGMAVVVDYSLFYLRREREERARGRSFSEALGVAARTSGRTIGCPA